MGDTTPAARLRMRQLRLSERTPVAMVDDETSTSDLDRAAALSPLLAREAVTIPVADDLSDRGMFTSAQQTDAALEQGAYGVAPSAMPVAAILGRSAAPAALGPGVYRLDPALTAVKDRAEWTERERVLAVADSLLDKLLALEQAFVEIDSANMILGDPIPAPPASGLTGTPYDAARGDCEGAHRSRNAGRPRTGMVVPIAKVHTQLQRRGNEKLLAQWTQLQRSIESARREREQLRQLLQAAWGTQS